MNTSLYSGVALKYFPEKWQHYNELQLSIFNPNSEPIQLTCRIHDRQHTWGPELHSDRFNREYLLAKIGRLDTLIRLYREPMIPKAVEDELSAKPGQENDQIKAFLNALFAPKNINIGLIKDTF